MANNSGGSDTTTWQIRRKKKMTSWRRSGFCQPFNELDQTANHPALSPVLAILSGEKKWQIILADLTPPRGKFAEKKNDVREEVWFGSFFQRLMVF
jgi:hypothetical protein